MIRGIVETTLHLKKCDSVTQLADTSCPVLYATDPRFLERGEQGSDYTAGINGSIRGDLRHDVISRFVLENPNPYPNPSFAYKPIIVPLIGSNAFLCACS